MADDRLRQRALDIGIDVPMVTDSVAIELAAMPEVRRLLDMLVTHGSTSLPAIAEAQELATVL